MNEDRTRESCVDIPFRQSLITGLASAILFALGTLGVRRWAGLPYSWVEVAIAAGSAAALGFCGTWLLLLWAMWPKRVQPEQPPVVTMAAPAPAPLEVQMPVVRPAFSAHDARRFVNDALYLVDGVWRDKDGGSSQRAMERKSWSREDWDLAVEWLLAHGILEWRNEAAHRQGTRWCFEKLDRFVGRSDG